MDDNRGAATMHAVIAAASFGLPGADLTAVSLRDRSQVEEFLRHVRDHRLQGLAAAAVDAGAVRGPGLADLSAKEHRAALFVCLAVEEATVRATDALGAGAVPVRVLKGVASAHLDYPAADQRVFVDIDLLVPVDRHAEALTLLKVGGFRRRAPAVREGWERRFAKSITHVSQAGVEVDLHLRLGGGYFGQRIDHAALWERPGTPVTIGARPLLALDPVDRLRHAAFHALLGDQSGLRSLRDVAQLVLVTGASWEEAVERCSSEGTETVLATAVTQAWGQLWLADHPVRHWAAALRSERVQLRQMDAYKRTFSTDEWAPEALSTLHALSPSDQLRFLTGLLMPTAASLKVRNRSRLEHLLEGARIFQRR